MLSGGFLLAQTDIVWGEQLNGNTWACYNGHAGRWDNAGRLIIALQKVTQTGL